MKRILFIVVVFMSIHSIAFAEEMETQLDRVVFIIGPQIGYIHYYMTKEEYHEMVSDYRNSLTAKNVEYYPSNIILGVNFEQRLLLGRTNSYFAFQEILTNNGAEQSLFLPSLTIAFGFRSGYGYELGIGEITSINGFAIQGYIGYIVSYNEINIPIDISATIPNNTAKTTIAITTGIDFKLGKRN
jgi:hypothetical protein